MTVAGQRMLDIVPDEDDPHALLAAQDPFGDSLACQCVAPNFRLTATSAAALIEDSFRKPG